MIYIADKLPSFIVSARDWLAEILLDFGFKEDKIPLYNIDFSSITPAIKNWLSSYSSKIVGDAVTVTTSVVGGIFDAFFSIVISVYILAQKEKIGRFVKNVINAFIPKKFSNAIYRMAGQANESFSRFIGGQLTESVILGVLCYIGMLIFRFPNAPIISVLICVTSLVPIVGAFAGVAIGALLILITSPIKSLLFIIFIIVLQQLEGNIIYPRVVGKAVGLPAVIVVSSVLVGGNVGGILGALIGVPISAIIYTLLKEFVENRKNKLSEN